VLLVISSRYMLLCAGVVDWAPYVPQLYTHMLACFKVPVGTATAGCPSTISAPHRATQLFGSKLDQVDDQPKSAAKLAVHLLKQPQQQQGSEVPDLAAAVATAASLEGALSLGLGPAGGSSGVSVQGILNSRQCAAEDVPDGVAAALAGEQQQQQGAAAGEGVPMSAAVSAAADALDSLVQLLEQYCHPSNTGHWSGDLAVFLRHGVHYFMKVCYVCYGGVLVVCW
jgi:hypothetical protein